jgi:sugar phosphate permease
MSIPLGAAAGVMFAGYVTQKYGWQAVFGVLAIPGLLIALLSMFMPEYKTKKIDIEEIEIKPKVTDFFRYVVSSPSLIFLYLGSAACMIAATSIPLWSPTYFMRTFHLNIREATQIVGLIGLLGFLGGPIGGWLGDFISKYTLKGRVIAMSISMVLFCIFALLAFRSTVYIQAVIMFALMGIFIFSYRCNVDASSQDLAPPYFRAMVYSFVPLFNHIAGGVPAPVITGAASDRFGLPFALQMTAIISTLLALIFFICASRFWKKDVEKIRALGRFKFDQR